jgi:hypothetical protein
MRKVALMFMLVFALAAVAATARTGSARASTSIYYGIQDDAWLQYDDYGSSLTERVMKLKQMGVGIVRFTLHWNEVAPTRPRNARNPNDPAYKWDAYDQVFDTLHTWKLPALVTLYGTPKWANGGKAPNWAPTSGSAFASFAYAAQRHYPWIRYWTIWNEPNKALFLRPTSATVYTTKLLNPAYAALHSANHSVLVGGGVTAPRAASGGVQPVTWIREMHAAHAKLDAYAHNPYPVTPKETPFTGGCANSLCQTITMASLPRLLNQVKLAFGNKRIWLTEYAYQVNPPDRFGVSPVLQAQYEADADRRAYETPRVDMLIHYLYRDEPNVAAWQSGLVTVKNVARPAFRSFELPLSQVSRKGSTTVLWGQVRPASGKRAYKIRVLRNGAWASLGTTHLTDSRGFFRLTVRAAKGARLILTSPVTTDTSPILVVK